MGISVFKILVSLPAVLLCVCQSLCSVSICFGLSVCSTVLYVCLSFHLHLTQIRLLSTALILLIPLFVLAGETCIFLLYVLSLVPSRRFLSVNGGTSVALSLLHSALNPTYLVTAAVTAAPLLQRRSKCRRRRKRRRRRRRPLPP